MWWCEDSARAAKEREQNEYVPNGPARYALLALPCVRRQWGISRSAWQQWLLLLRFLRCLGRGQRVAGEVGKECGVGVGEGGGR